MLAHRATAFFFTSRHRPLSIPLRSPISRYSAHSPAGPSTDLKKSIFEEARLLRQQEKSIPWYQLAAKHHLSIDVVQGIFSQAEADAQRRQQQSALVTRAAEEHFDSALGQCDWEAVSREVGIPLIECLDLYDASTSTIQSRSLIETNGGWSTLDMEGLKRFIATNYADNSAVDWRLAGVLMNVDSLECQRVGLGIFNGPINEVAYRRISEFRESKLGWKEIHQHFQQYPDKASVANRYRGHKLRLQGKTHDVLSAPWTDAERDLVNDLIRRHLRSTTKLELLGIIQRELPARPLSDIRIFYAVYVYGLKLKRLSKGQMVRLQELVAEYGEDWDRIGEALGILPSRARHNWVEFGGDVVDYSALTADEARHLQLLTDAGARPKEAARLLGIRPYRIRGRRIVTAKATAPRQKDDTPFRSFWAAADEETLLKMANEPTANITAKWEHISKTLGRTITICKTRARILRRSRMLERALDDNKSLVTSEVQRQLGLGGAADWSQVSQATGLGIRECLELSQHDDGKARWHYDTDTSSQAMIGRMTSFIKEHYPAPTPVNYRAVSNFMWIVMEDCIQIHEMAQCKFTWTEANVERAAALRAQGLTYKEVARRLSPVLPAYRVFQVVKSYSSHKQAPNPASVFELEEISRLADEYAGKHSVVDIATKIRKQLKVGGRHSIYSMINLCIAAHPHYQAKVRDIDYSDLANRIAKGQTTVSLAAKELDVPYRLLVDRMRGLDSRLYSPKWTDEEIRKLIDLVRSCDSQPSHSYISKVIGTKSSMQCRTKLAYLRLKGVLPPAKKKAE